MTSSCELKFDDMFIDSAKADVPNTFIFLFQESDRRVVRASDCAGMMLEVRYSAAREIVLRRLDFGGYTADRAQECFEAWLDEERRTYSTMPEFEPFAELSAALKDFSYDEWKRRIKTVLATRFDTSQPRDTYIDETDKNMRDGSWLAFDEDLIIIRAMLEALPDVKEVTLDITDLVYAGWIDIDDPICRSRRESDAQPRSILQPTVIIAEGSTDTRILRRSLDRLYPHLSDYITFFDYEESKPDGGASFVVKFLKAFAAARINTHFLAIFDNDAAGLEALHTAQSLNLPKNIGATVLPDIDLALAYPTIGPQGMHEIDVNGKAASIELYVGRHNLTDTSGGLIPVVWESYNKRQQTYQGVVQPKDIPIDRFLKETEIYNSSVDYHSKFPELVAVWEHIFYLLQPVWLAETEEDEED